MDELLALDEAVFLFLNNLGSDPWDGLWRFITEKYSSIPLYAILLYLIFKKLGWKATLIVLVVVALMITATDQLANLFKYGFERPRPCQEELLSNRMRFVADGCGRFGFFSAHAASSMAAAVFLGLLLRKYYRLLPFVLLFWAVIVAYSRIYLGVHYPLDIIVGMFFGGLIGWLCYKLQWLLREKFIVS